MTAQAARKLALGMMQKNYGAQANKELQSILEKIEKASKEMQTELDYDLARTLYVSVQNSISELLIDHLTALGYKVECNSRPYGPDLSLSINW